MLVSFFTACTLITTLMGDEVTPFFVWGMFSAKETPQYEQEIVEIRINDEVFNYYESLTNFNRHMLVVPIEYYAQMQRNKGVHPTRSFFQERLSDEKYKRIYPILSQITNDAKIKTEFEDWVLRYADNSTNEPIDRIEVFLNTYQYESPKRLILIKQDTIINL